MKSTIGKNIKTTIWGGSHEASVGVEIIGLPLGSLIDMTELEAFLRRRAPKGGGLGTGRKEADIPIPLNGLRPLGGNDRVQEVVDASVSFEIKNTDTRSSDYKTLRDEPRPGHADFTARMRYGEGLNMAGGGPFSARMTAPLCIAGGIALQLLGKQGIRIGAHIKALGLVEDIPFDSIGGSAEMFDELKEKELAVIDIHREELMREAIMDVKREENSLGGIIEVCAVNLPAGIGGAMYDGLESAMAPIFFGIPAVKGVEFGAGFAASAMKGSENNDPFYYHGDVVRTKSNNHGGILGGISTGMPLIARVAFKPTPSIGIVQESVNLHSGENTVLKINGRHDPCVVVRAVPIVEGAMALGILDCIMERNND